MRGYELRGFEPAVAQQVETHFFRPLDSTASDALRLLESVPNDDWSARLRSAWTKFLISLELRCPEDVSAFRKLWAADMAKTTASE